MAKISTPSDTSVLAVHGRRSTVDDATLSHSPVPEASSTASKTRLEKPDASFQPSPRGGGGGGGSGSSLGLLCLDELSAMSVHTVGADRTPLPRHDSSIGPTCSLILPPALTQRSVLGSADNSDDENDTDTMLPAVRLADEELQRLAQDLSDFDCNSPMLSSDEYDEIEERSSNHGYRAYYDLGSHQDGDGVEDAREAGAGRYSTDDEEGDAGAGYLSSGLRGSGASDVGLVDVNQGLPRRAAISPASRCPALPAASHDMLHPPSTARPDLVGSSGSGQGSLGAAIPPPRCMAETLVTSGPMDGCSRFPAAEKVVRQRAEGRSEESSSGSRSGAAGLPASMQQTRCADQASGGARDLPVKLSPFEPDNPEAQRRMRPMGDDLFRLPMPSSSLCATSRSSMTVVSPVGPTALGLTKPASDSSSSTTVQSDGFHAPVNIGQDTLAQSDECETSQQLASRYMLPGTAEDDDEDDDAGNEVAASSASEVTLTGFLHSPPACSIEAAGFMSSFADQQDLNEYLGSEVFKSGASAIEVLKQDELLCAGSKSATFSENTVASWAADAADTRGTPSTSIEQYIAARTEAIGSLSGGADTRPRFGDGTIVSPPTGIPRRLLLPDDTVTASPSRELDSALLPLTHSCPEGPVDNASTDSQTRCTASHGDGSAARFSEKVQSIVSVERQEISRVDAESTLGEKMAVHGTFTEERPLAGASQKVSPIKAFPSSASLKPNTGDSSSLWFVADVDDGCNAAAISLNSTLKPSTEVTVDRSRLAGQQSTDVVAAGAAGNATVPPEQAGEQSSIVSYSFVSKITAEARKAGAASSELAAYIIKLSQQQQQQQQQAKPQPPRQDVEAKAPIIVGAFHDAVNSDVASSASNSLFPNTQATAVLADAIPTATARSTVNALSSPGSPIGHAGSLEPLGMAYCINGQVGDSCNAFGGRRGDSKGSAAGMSILSPAASARASSSMAAALSSPSAAAAVENRVHEPQQQPLPPLVAAAECGCSASRNACRQQSSTTASPAKKNATASADSSWFWSSDATMSSSRSLNLDLSSAEGGSLQKPNGELSDHVRLSALLRSSTGHAHAGVLVECREGAPKPVSTSTEAGELAVGNTLVATTAGRSSSSVAVTNPVSAIGHCCDGVSVPASVDRTCAPQHSSSSGSSLVSLSTADGLIAATTPITTATDWRHEEAGVAAIEPSALAGSGRSPVDLGRAVSLTSPSLLPSVWPGGRDANPQPFIFSTARGVGNSQTNSARHPASVPPSGDSSNSRLLPSVVPAAEQSSEVCASLAGRFGRNDSAAEDDSQHQHQQQSQRTTREVLQQNTTSGRSSAMSKSQHQQQQMGYDVRDLCTVQVPSEVRIEEVCCVGFSLQTQLEMYNRNSRWVSVSLKVVNQSLDGSEEKCAKAVPFILKQKARLEPGTTEILPIVFAPQRPGIYMAQLLVDTSWLVPVTKEDGRLDQLGATSIVNIVANAELPRVEALNVTDGCVNFGYVPWKCTRHFQVSLVNKGHAGVPLRLIISSLKGGTYGCFCFSSCLAAGHEGGVREGSRVVQNLILPARCPTSGSSTAASQSITPVDVALTFAAPAKSYNSSTTGEAETFQAVLNVELDNPSAVEPLFVIRLQATVGSAKIHTPAVEGVKLAGSCGSVIQETVPIRNAGSIPFGVQFSILGEDGGAFTVFPSRAYLDPNEDFNAIIKCDTRRLSSVISKSMLLMSVEPDGPTFEVGLTVHASTSGATAPADVASMSRRAASATDRLAEERQHGDPRSRSSEPLMADRELRRQTHFGELQQSSGINSVRSGIGSSRTAITDQQRKLFNIGDNSGSGYAPTSVPTLAAVLYSNRSCLTFGGVPVGQEVEQSFNLRNVLASCVRIALDISLSSKTRAAAGREADRTCFRLVGFGSSNRPASDDLAAVASQELVLMPLEDYTVRIRFAPRKVAVYGAKLKIYCAHNGATYMMRMSGYGGIGSISLEPLDSGSGCGASASALLETRRGFWQLSLDYVSAGGHLVSADVQLRNVGSRSIFARVACFADRDCEEKMSIGKITIQPEQFVLSPGSAKVISITYSMSEKDRIMCEKAGQIVGVVSLYYGDEILRQKLKRLLKSSTAHAKVKSKHRLADYNFDFYFLHEEEFDEDVCLPDDPREVDYFFSSLKQCRLELVVYPSVASKAYKRVDLARDVSMEPLMYLNDTTCEARDSRLLVVDGQPSARYPAERPMLEMAFDSTADVCHSWSVEPSVVLLTLVKTELERQIKKVRVVNNSDDPLPFDISWPASYVVVTPESGVVEPRSFVSLCLSAKVGLTRRLPWSGSLYVMARAVAKSVSLVIEEARTSAFASVTGRTASSSSTPPLSSSSHPSSVRDFRLLPGGSENGKYRPILDGIHTDDPKALPVKREVERRASAGVFQPPLASVHRTVPHAEPASGDKQSAARASSDTAVYIKHKEHFPVTPVGQSSTVKITLCNRSSAEQRVSLTTSSPFSLKQATVNVRPGHFVKLPVTFRPTESGSSQGQLVLISADGKRQSLILKATTTSLQ